MFGRIAARLSPARLAPAAAGVTLLQSAQASHCASAGGGSSPLDLLPSSIPPITPLQLQLAGVSGFAGYTAGFAIKRAFRVAIFTTGVCFMGLQASSRLSNLILQGP